MHLPRYVPWTTLLVAACFVPALDADAAIKLQHLWTNNAGGLERAEIVVFDSAAQEFLVGNGPERCVMRLDARSGKEKGRFDVSLFGDPTSVAASHGLVAVAVVAPQKTDPGHIVFFRSAASGPQGERGDQPLAVVRVTALPDMVTFTPDGRYALSANEGEPSEDYSIDPEGSISVIDVSRGAEHAVAVTADFLRFNPQRDELEREGVRISGPSAKEPDGRATVAQDVEPEYLAIAPDGRTAWATLQENNALAIIDIPSARVTSIVPLGLKDHSRPGNGFDGSDRDGGIHIRRWPVFGMYQPDGIAAFDLEGQTYLVTANEGDTRGYAGFSDEARVKDLKLDESLQRAGNLQRDDLQSDDLQSDDAIGRLHVSRVGGDTDGDGDVDRLLSFGGRSAAVWSADGQLLSDSGDALEQFIAKHLPDRFNIDEDGVDKVDDRSDDKGPEPEGVAIGRVGDATYAFVGLERTSGIAVFDVTRPEHIELVDVVPLAVKKDKQDPTGGPHIAPEGIYFVPAERSPLGAPLLAVACEVTGTTLVFRVDSVSTP